MLSPMVTSGNPMVMDCGTSPIQQWNRSAGLSTSNFVMNPSGSNWTLSPLGQSGKCVDVGGGSNGTGLVINSCNGQTSQSFTIAPVAQNGSFTVAAVSTGRCITVRGNSTAAGAVMEVDDCSSGSSSQQFGIQATAVVGDTSNQTSSSSSSSTTTNNAMPCAAYCSSPINIGSQSFNSGNIGTGAACYQSSYPIAGGNSSNMSGRTFTVNGQSVSTNANFNPPAKVNGGYCFQVGSGGLSYAAFTTW
jgi:hypothetical protein